MNIWAFEYCSRVYESAMAVQSLHLTKEGAEKAQSGFIKNEFERYLEGCGIMRHKPMKYDVWLRNKQEYEAWQVKEWEVN